MDERQMIAALRSRDPSGIAGVYDRYAEGLYDYCWWLLRDHGTAREALHDALLATGVHADALRSPERLRPWLYALVRAECLRRSPATPRTDEEADAVPDDSELRSLAWKATEAVPPSESDALELHVRHSIECPDLATILRRSESDAGHLLERGNIHLGQALRVEMLVRTGPAECQQLAGLLQDLQDQADPEQYDKVSEHARSCSMCSQRVPRRVSVSRLMALLPTVAPPADLRQRVIDAYGEAQLLEYRLLAARRLQPLGRDGFPQAGIWRRPHTARTAALATVTGLVTAGLCAVGAVAAVQLDSFPPGTSRDDGVLPYKQVGVPSSAPAEEKKAGSAGAGTAAATGQPESPARDAAPGVPAGAGKPYAPSSAGFLGARDTTRPGGGSLLTPWLPPGRGSGTGSGSKVSPRGLPPSATSSDAGQPPSSPGTLRVSTAQLDLGTAREAELTLSARGGTVQWSAVSTDSCVGASPAAGSMGAGKQVAVTVTVDRSSAGCPPSGAASVSMAEGGPSIDVTWSAPETTPPSPTGTENSSPPPQTASPSPSESSTSPSP